MIAIPTPSIMARMIPPVGGCEGKERERGRERERERAKKRDILLLYLSIYFNK